VADRSNAKYEIAWINFFALATAGLALFATTAYAGHEQAKMYAWTSPSTACAGQATAPATSIMGTDVENWYEEMDDQGWTKSGKVVDGSLSPDWFCDHDVSGSTCSDGTRGDGADAMMVGMHGQSTNDAWQGFARQPSNTTGSCFANDTGQEMHFGDWDLEYLHLESCHSADDHHLPSLWQTFRDPVDTYDTSASNYGRRLHLLSGYHGNALGSWFYRNESAHFARDAHSVSISDAWFDNLYHSWVYYTGGDSGSVCPITYAVEDTRALCRTALSDEGYGNRDTSDPVSNSWYCYDYVEDCDPAGENAFVVSE
jgi:hypothetical protein